MRLRVHAYKGQQSVWLLKLKFQVVVGCQTGLLGGTLWSSTRAVNTLNH